MLMLTWPEKFCPGIPVFPAFADVDGEQVFTALLTITNEKGEIRTCNVVATKAQSQTELALV